MRTVGSRGLMQAMATAMMTVHGLALPSMAHGQTAPPAEQDTLPDIVVSATKRDQNVQQVPISIAVVSPEQLRDRNLTATTQLQHLVPGLTYVAGATANTSVFSVRGIGTIANNVGLEPSVGVTRDGVPVARSLGTNFELVDIDRVEVLNGPQGTVFGKNASAGVIAVVTRKPVMNAVEVAARAAYASFDYSQLSTTINVPLGGTVAARASIWGNRHDGIVDGFRLGRDFGDLDTRGGRLRLRWQPSATIDFNVIGEWTGHAENGQATTLRAFKTGSPIFAAQGGARVEAYERGQGVIASPTNLRTSTTRTDLGTDGETQAYTGELVYDGGGATLTLLGGYRRVEERTFFEATGTGNPFFIGDNRTGDHNIYRQYTGEVRLTSPAANRLRYVLGGFFYRLALGVFVTVDSNTAPTANTYFSVVSNTKINTTNYAGFGEATYDVMPALRLTAGARLSHDANDGTLDRVYGRPAASGLPRTVNGPGTGFGPISLAVDDVDYTNLAGRVSVQYDVAPAAMTYATVSRGYKGPGINFAFNITAATLGTSAVKPEISTMYELGLKSMLFDRRVRLNLALFDQTIDDFQATVRLQGFPAFVIQNAKQLKSTGATAEIDARIGAGLTLSGSGSYTDARYTDYKNAGCYGGQSVAQGCVGGVQSLDGYALPSAPRWAFNVTARYEQDESDALCGVAQVNDAFRSSFVFNADRDPNEIHPGYNLINLLVGVRRRDDRWGVNLFVNNLFDTHFVSRIGTAASNSWFVQNPTIDAYRSVGVALTIHS